MWRHVGQGGRHTPGPTVSGHVAAMECLGPKVGCRVLPSG